MPEVLGELLTPQQYERLAWSAEFDPPLGRRIDRGFALLGFLIANQWRGKDTKIIPMEDFLPDWDGMGKEKDWSTWRPPATDGAVPVRTADEFEDLGGDDDYVEEYLLPAPEEVQTNEETIRALVDGFSQFGMYAPRYAGTIQVVTADMLDDPDR